MQQMPETGLTCSYSAVGYVPAESVTAAAALVSVTSRLGSSRLLDLCQALELERKRRPSLRSSQRYARRIFTFTLTNSVMISLTSNFILICTTFDDYSFNWSIPSRHRGCPRVLLRVSVLLVSWHSNHVESREWYDVQIPNYKRALNAELGCSSRVRKPQT